MSRSGERVWVAGTQVPVESSIAPHGYQQEQGWVLGALTLEQASQMAI